MAKHSRKRSLKTGSTRARKPRPIVQREDPLFNGWSASSSATYSEPSTGYSRAADNWDDRAEVRATLARDLCKAEARLKAIEAKCSDWLHDDRPRTRETIHAIYRLARGEEVRGAR